MSLASKCAEWDVSPGLVEKLQKMGYSEFFSIQEDVVPVLIRQNSNPRVIPRDIYVSSPTGSGKTLAYALPVADYFLKSGFVGVHRLRCLILLPNRELALQVNNFFVSLLKGTGINVSMTVGNGDSEEELSAARSSLQLLDNWSVNDEEEDKHLHTDILISTSGKLLDNLLFTPGFSLQHLRFLILDEADRLLSNAYHGWVRTLLSSVENIRSASSNGVLTKKRRYGEMIDDNLPLQRLLFSATATDDPKALSLLGIISPLFIYNRSNASMMNNNVVSTRTERENDESFVAENTDHDLFVLPATLLERRMTVTTDNKLFKLITLLIASFNPKKRDVDSSVRSQQLEFDYMECCRDQAAVCIIFVASVDASHRLSTLLRLLNGQLVDNDVARSFKDIFGQALSGRKSLFPGRVEEMTRLVRPAEREKVLADAARGDVSIIVSSDRMARGMDLANIKLVVNYEVPKQAKSYVHRAGRTARAGRVGRCLTLVKEGQYKEFQRMSIEIKRSTEGRENHEDSQVAAEPTFVGVKKMVAYRLPEAMEEVVRPFYDVAVKNLSQHLN